MEILTKSKGGLGKTQLDKGAEVLLKVTINILLTDLY